MNEEVKLRVLGIEKKMDALELRVQEHYKTVKFMLISVFLLSITVTVLSMRLNKLIVILDEVIRKAVLANPTL